MKLVRFLILVLFWLSLGAFVVWRGALPNNRFHPTRDHFAIQSDGRRFYVQRWLHDYDDVMTVVTVHNFLRDGLWFTHLLPNRGSFPQAEFFDRKQDQCEHARAGSPLRYRTPVQWVPMQSINGDCIYTHFPPLAYWLYTAAAWLGLDQFIYYKILAASFNIAFLIVFYQWLRREVSGGVALVGVLVMGTVPAFLSWIDALYYQPFHFLFLFLGFLTWSAWLRTSLRRHLGFTWLWFFAESLVSYDLTLFMGVAMVGLTLAEHGFPGARRYWRSCLLQFTAPVVAFAFQLSLRVSLLGLNRTLANVKATAVHRMTDVSVNGLSLLFDEAGRNIMPWSFAAVSLLVYLGVGRQLRVPIRRALTLASMFFVGACSFIAVMPGTAAFHHMVTYRYFLPFMIYSLVLALDASMSAVVQLLRARAVTGQRRRQWLLATGALLPIAMLVYVAHDNGTYVLNEVLGNLDSNRTYEPLNLARRALDVLYWTEDGQPTVRPPILPLSGKRVNEPRRWLSDFRLVGPGASHYEVWWLDPQQVRTVRLLVDEKAAAEVANYCSLSAFHSNDFQSLVSIAGVSVRPFIPTLQDSVPRVPYAWVEFDLRSTQLTQSIRLTCSGIEDFALRQWEAYAQSAPDDGFATASR